LLVGAGFLLSSSSPFLLAGLRAVVMARSGFQRWKKVRQLFFFKCCEIVTFCFTSRFLWDSRMNRQDSFIYW
jgi:hypothetical protein